MPTQPARINRRGFVRRGLAAGAGLGLGGLPDYFALGGPGRAAAEVANNRLPDAPHAGMITEPAQRAINQGLAYLAANRHPNGSYGTGQYRGNVAITSLAGLAMMSGGHLPGRGTYGPVVSDAVRYVLSQENGTSGYLNNQDASPHGPMYGHGFGTLFLAEVYGSVNHPDLRDKVRDTLRRAVQLTISSQNAEGGWRYKPTSRDADISVTICQIMALRAARNAGIAVPKGVVDRCIEYVKKCQDQRSGGFRYMAQGGPPAFARTAAGIVALQTAGIYQGPEIDSGLNYLMEFKPAQTPFRHPHMPDLHYFYGHYYAAQALWTAGGPRWAEWYPAIRDELVNRMNRQRGGGAWFDSICVHYGTSMACIILQIPNNYLPILQK